MTISKEVISALKEELKRLEEKRLFMKEQVNNLEGVYRMERDKLWTLQK